MSKHDKDINLQRCKVGGKKTKKYRKTGRARYAK
jgi:hypothetical protein